MGLVDKGHVVAASDDEFSGENNYARCGNGNGSLGCLLVFTN